MLSDEEVYKTARELYLKGRRGKRRAVKMLSGISGYPPAAFLLAALLTGNNKRVGKKAMKLFLFALPYYLATNECDDAERQLRLGAYYYFGYIGAEKDYGKAVKWFGVAANGGEAKAQFYLSKCYMEGKGCECDVEQSMYWLQKAAAQNEPLALTAYGYYCISGTYVEKDIAKGLELLKRAIAQGERRALILYRAALIAYNIQE